MPEHHMEMPVRLEGEGSGQEVVDPVLDRHRLVRWRAIDHQGNEGRRRSVLCLRFGKTTVAGQANPEPGAVHRLRAGSRLPIMPDLA